MQSLRAAAFPDAAPVRLTPGEDPRMAFADWLISPKNPWFARNAVNRVWFWLLGRGIIHPADDIRPDNPAANPELLAFLEQDLIAARYDMKHLYRQILNSTTYQLSCVARSDDPRAEANFAQYPLRRLEAEVMIDALCQITGTTEQYSSIIPEPYTFMPENQRAVALADASITSPFLEKFGRSSRDTGLESDRNNRPTAAQRLHLLEFEPCPAEDRDEPEAPGPAGSPTPRSRKTSWKSISRSFRGCRRTKSCKSRKRMSETLGPMRGRETSFGR